MNIELLSMLGGGLAGFIFKFMSQSMENAQKTNEMLLARQAVADDSADRAAKRGGSHIGRRVLVFTILWVLCFAPFVGALLGIDVWVEDARAPWDVLGVFTGGWDKVQGIVILPEIRAALLAAVGFYLGNSSISRRR